MINWEAYGFVISSKYRVEALKLLENPLTPNQVSNKLKLSLAHGSKIIRELYKKKLVECKNPSAKKGRIYQRTTQSEEILERIKQAE